MKIKIYHNPRWGKSRDSVRILEKRECDFEIIEYLKNTPTAKDIKQILSALNMDAKDIIRTNEKEYKDNSINKIKNENELINAIAHHPKILQRPIIISDEGKAVIGRPPENIFDII